MIKQLALIIIQIFFSLSMLQASQSVKINIENDTCVDINLKNGRTIVAKIIKSNSSEVFYRKCEGNDKEIHRISTYNITSIVKGDAKSQMEAYGKGKLRKHKKTSNAIIWSALTTLIGLLLLPSIGLAYLIMMLLGFSTSIIGLSRLIKNKNFPNRNIAIFFLILTFLITSILGVAPILYVLFIL